MRRRLASAFTALLEHRFGGACLFILVFLTFASATRVTLAVAHAGSLTWNPSLLAAFVWGALFDLAAAGWWSLPLVLALAVAPTRSLDRVAARAVMHAGIFLGSCGLLFVGVAEWLFWDEFGARFNFIAVDYLVYTREVVGNIRESYPMPLVLGGLAFAAACLHLALARTGWLARWLDNAAAPAAARWRFAAVWTAAVLALGLGLNERLLPSWKNNYNREIAKNGPWSFVAAFRANRLDYDEFYPTLPFDAAFARLHAKGVSYAESAPSADRDLLRLVPAPEPAAPERRLNVIQITVESLSAEFLGRYGSTPLRKNPSFLKASTPPAPAPIAAWRPSLSPCRPRPAARW